jgi:LPS sulfotransferase NodH
MQRSLLETFPELATYDEHDFGRASIRKPVLFIAITARTGSRHLCGAIRNTGKFNNPAEIFNPRGPVFYDAKRLNATTFADYIQKLGAEAGDAFAFKTNWLDFSPVARGYKAMFPDVRFVYLDRRDIEAQAVSLFRARLTGEWHIPVNSKTDHVLVSDDSYDFGKLRHLVSELRKEKARWRAFFEAETIDAPVLYYEDWSANPAQAVSFIFERCGLDPGDVTPTETGFRKTPDPVLNRWAERLREDMAGLAKHSGQS